MGPWMMGDYGMGFSLFGGIVMLLLWLLIIGGAVLLIVWLVRRAPAPAGTPNQSALEMLKWRYAKGEITKKQFDQMKKDIGA